jgi:hypothetical protein
MPGFILKLYGLEKNKLSYIDQQLSIIDAASHPNTHAFFCNGAFSRAKRVGYGYLDARALGPGALLRL